MKSVARFAGAPWRSGQGLGGKLLVVALAVIASLLLVAVPVGVLLISADESSQVFEQKLSASINKSMHYGDQTDARGYASTMRYTAMRAPTIPGMSQAEAEERIEKAYQNALPGLALRLPAEFSPSGRERIMALSTDDDSELNMLVVALQRYRQECLTELDRRHARKMAAMEEPDSLAAAEMRVIAAADTWQRAKDLTNRRESAEAIQQIRRNYHRRKIAAVAVLVVGSLLAAVSARTMARRRRASLGSLDATHHAAGAQLPLDCREPANTADPHRSAP
ncbi:hypothetical protein [Jidongwangia harbinensis]|uniref:hypothetical protein n=1 Tax=Jidongwangia harbinensis TaxID=2878561 RepID=UPI001CDA4D00|nr:hypothetical protein [Jidongwangia harbinensis]MCA2217670.1 hypothetical protein [Jidongwangia harbinensis]